MIANVPIGFVIMPETTYVMLERLSQVRRIYTDGRAWPAQLKPSSLGYSIGKWIDEDGDGRYDTLEAETRGLKHPHVYDSSGMPFHPDERAIVKERIRLDKANPNMLRNEITVIDNALTRPWTVTRSYRRERDYQWSEYVCAANNQHVVIGKEDYFLSADGLLMPAFCRTVLICCSSWLRSPLREGSSCARSGSLYKTPAKRSAPSATSTLF